MGRLIMLIALVAWVAVPALATEDITGDQFVALVSDGEAIGDLSLSDLTVTGDVDLSSLEAVQRPIRCTGCVFQGSFTARDTTFTEIVEFVSTTFEDAVDFEGGLFRRPVIFDQSRFHSSVALTSSRFEDLVSFGNVTFAQRTDFERASFNGTAIFQVSNPTTLGLCDPDIGGFINTATFRRASFGGTADFRGGCFGGAALFSEVSFEGRVDFTRASFLGRADFEGTTLQSGAVFRVADFDEGAFFRDATSAGLLDFTGAAIAGRLDFTRLSGGGSLSLSDVRTPGSRGDPVFVMNELGVAELVFAPDRVDLVGGPAVQEEVLEMIQSTAEARGQIELANDAKFELLALRARDLSSWEQALDWFFYRTIAGYLVRPIHPILSILFLVFVAGAVRLVHRQYKRSQREFLVSAAGTDGVAPPARPGRERSHRAVLVVADAFSSYSDSLKVAWRAKPGEVVPEAEDDQRVPIRSYLMSLVRFLEWLAYRVLIAVAVIGVANSLPIVKDLIDAVF